MRSILYIPLLSLALIHCAPEKGRLFKRVPVTHSGITFSNDLQSDENMNALVFTNFYNGGGVGIADFNLDGIPDICFTANQKAPELYIGKGGLKFEKVAASGLENPGWINGISIVDINQDGRPDIYLSMAKHQSLSHSANRLYINQNTPTPTFKEESARYGLDFSGYTTQTVFFDYDLDGDLDAYLLNTAPDAYNPNTLRPPVHDGTHPSADKLFENIGKQADGMYRYQDVSVKSGITYEGLGLGIALADVNRDGYTDIYCSNDFQSDDILYLNNGDGTFSNTIKQAVKHNSQFGMGIDAADFNNDLLTDILQLDMLPEDGERQKRMIARGDYEKLRRSVSPPYNYHLQFSRNSLQVNQGSSDGIPYFSEQGLMYNIAASDWSWSVLFADFDLDTWKDVFISNGYRKNVTDLDFINFHKDFNRFGNAQGQKQNREKLLTEIPEIKLRNYAFKNVPGEAFQNVSSKWGLDEASYSNGAAYADLDLDGDLDLVVNNIDEPAFLYENLCKQKNYIKISFKGYEGNAEGIGAKVTVCAGDTCQVYDYFPARGYLSSMNTPLVMGLGKKQTADVVEVQWPGGKRQQLKNVASGTHLICDAKEAEEVTPDQTSLVTIFTPGHKFPNYIHRESDFIDFRKTPTLQKMLSRNGPVIEKGDFNGDKRMDIVLGGAFDGSPTLVYIQQENGSFSLWDTLATPRMEVGALAVLDVNEDGRSDVLVVPGISDLPMSYTEAYQALLFISSAKGLDLHPSLPKMNICSESILIQDFNGDNKSDVLIGGTYIPDYFPQTCPSILLLQEHGTFRIQERNPLPPDFPVKDMEALDIDQDGDQDILAVGHWQKPLLLRNEGNNFVKEPLNLDAGWWNCLKAADVDGDGDQDIVLGNEGLNTLFKASMDKPVTLLAKDFNLDGRIDPIWGLYLKNEEVSIHPLGTLSDQIVQFKKRYLYFKNYSKAGLYDLFTKEDLKEVQKYQVTELRSGIALNEGKDQYRFIPLPFHVQQSPVNDIVIDDFNDDAIPDLILAANFYPNEPIFGQSDASLGHFLTGKGGGAFQEIPTSKSGLKLNGDMRKICYLKQDGLLFFTQNSDSVLSYALPKKILK